MEIATNHYRDHVTSFWANSEIRKTVTDKNYIPNGIKLSKSLHDENNLSVTNKLSKDAKDAALYQLITQERGTSAGKSLIDSSGVSKRYSSLPVTTKKIIASYNPEADKMFESLSSRNQFSSDQLSSQMNKLLQKKNKITEDIEKERFGFGKGAMQSDLSSDLVKLGVKGAFAKILGTALLPTAVIGKSAQKSLTSPSLISSYIQGTRFPTKSGIDVSQPLGTILKSLLTTNLAGNRGQ
jgi:hypothetical protein